MKPIRFYCYPLLAFCVFISISFSTQAYVPAEVQAVFVDNGCLNCHGVNNPSGNLSLADAITSEAQLVNISASCDANRTRVIPGDPENSILYTKISMANPDCGGVMPPNGNLIPVEDRNTIYNWIVSIGPAAEFGLIEMEATTATAQETDADITLTVNRQLGTQGEVSVDYAVATVGTDTATSPEDYTAASGTLVFAAGETSKTIVVSLADDEVFEGSEVFSVTLSNVMGGAVLGGQAQTKVTIVDNEFANTPGTFFFNRVAYEANENQDSFDVTILRSFGAAGQVTVDLNSAPGTATDGADYQTFSQTIAFAEGEQNKVVVITLLDDQQEEGTENFTLSLSNPTNEATLGSPAVVTVTLIDDETDTGGGDAGGGGDSGGGDGDGSSEGGGTEIEAPEAEEYSAAGALYWLLPWLLFGLCFRHRRDCQE